MVHYSEPKEKFILYQGAVNEGRCFETLIPAMKEVNAKLWIVGKGNLLHQVRELISEHTLEEKIEIRGNLPPAQLIKLTPAAYLGITLFESTGMNQYYSLANRFFDYIMAGIPQLCVNYPEYAAINKRFNVAYLVNDTQPGTITAVLNNLLANDVLYQQLRSNCLKARAILNWEMEQQILLDFYKAL
jgi:glycosyltransferase involved in cell wall biosynthesis